MRLLSAAEDLAIRTLENVPGALCKLLYLAALRDSEGRYCHWGLARVHGEAESEQAARDAHSTALKEVLRKPIRELFQELDSKSAENARSHQFRRTLETNSRLLPPGSSRAAEFHLKSVIQALDELDRARKSDPNPPAA